MDDGALVEEIRLVVTELPSYGYRRVWGILRREHSGTGQRQARVPSHAYARVADATKAAATSSTTSPRWQGRSRTQQPTLVFGRL
jgi:hypothetical protein